ncbi:MAG: branched-chain amino acid ABC transporter permease [Alphaproteobacteria bacterium]|nr:branched-chain amino acid ABC transporter permease [Alphaproteobacteria bacterium]
MVMPFLIYPVFLMQALSLALFACAFNLLLGYAGILSFGHAAFLGSAAYVCGYAAKEWHLPPELAILCGAGAAGLLGLVYGILATRQRGIYLAMITFALSQLVYFIAVEVPFTHGEDGLTAIPRRNFLGFINLAPSLKMYYFVFGTTLLALLLIARIVRSPFGQVLRAMKDNERRMVSLGYDVDRFKIAIFVISAALSGVAGSLKALSLGIASLGDVYWHVNGEVILMTLLGGMGTQLGPVVGAFLVVAIQNYFAQLGGDVTVIEGCIFAAIVLALRRGIIGEIGPVVGRFLSSQSQLAFRRNPDGQAAFGRRWWRTPSLAAMRQKQSYKED